MRSLRPSVFALFVCVGSALSSSTARAGFQATFLGADPSVGSFTYFASGSTGGSAPNGQTHTSAAGLMNWHTTSPNAGGLPNSQGNFVTFCIDVSQRATSPTTFMAQSLVGLPAPAPQMNADKADNLTQFLYRWQTTISQLAPGSGASNLTLTLNDSSTVTHNQNKIAAAIQLAIWEIVYETPTNYDLPNYDVKNGSGFYVNSGSGNINTVRTLANTLLGQVNYQLGGRANVVGLLASGGTAQDQVAILPGGWTPDEFGNIVSTPAPAAVVLALTGLVPCVVLRRRFAGQPTAN